MAVKVNSVQQAGFDLNGSAGVAMFNLGAPIVQVAGQYSDKSLVVSAGFVTPPAGAIANLGSSYQLKVTDTSPSLTFSLTNLSNNTTTSGLSAATLATTAANAGFNISFSGGNLTTGDTFQISPSANAAATLQVNPALTDPKQIAAATTAAGTPGDNSNALALATLQTQSLMNNGSSTFSQMYSQLIAGVGANTNAAQLNSSAQNTVLQNATAAQQSISGVNLNEEAANLIQFQNAYQAAAKTVSVAQSLFTALIGAVN
jgi:flagellar hook-associated protein 1 FlgK